MEKEQKKKRESEKESEGSKNLCKWINEESIRKEIIDYILTILKREDVIDLQQKVDDYFLSTGKEIGYIFIPDSELINASISEWTCTINGDSDSELESKLLHLGFAFKEEDAKKFAKTYSSEDYGLLKKKVLKGFYGSPYVRIVFWKDLDGIEWVTKNVFGKKIPPFKNKLPGPAGIEDEFERYSKDIQDLGLSEYYIISKANYSIEVKKGSVEEIRQIIVNSIKNNSDSFIVNKSISSLDDISITQESKFHGNLFFLSDMETEITSSIEVISASSKAYFKVKPKKIISNLNTFHKNLNTLKLNKKPSSGVFNKWLTERDGEFFLEIPGVDNFSTLKSWLDKQMLSGKKEGANITDRNLLLEELYYGNIIGVTLTGRREISKQTGTWTQFFKIYITDLKSMLSASIKKVDPMDIFDISPHSNSYTDDAVDFSKVIKSFKETIKEYSYDDAKDALVLRFDKCCDLHLHNISK